MSFEKIKNGVSIITHKFKKTNAYFTPIIGGRKVFHPDAKYDNGDMIILYFEKGVTRDICRHAYMNYAKSITGKNFKSQISAKICKSN
jgi:hypothetical protein